MRRIAVLLLSLFCLVALAIPCHAGGFQEGDTAVGLTYGLQASSVDFNDRGAPQYGLSMEYWLLDDLSLEFSGCLPRDDAGMENLSGAVQLNYAFGALYIPLRGLYLAELESTAVGTGAGINFLAGDLNLRFQASAYYLMQELEDRTGWDVQGAVRWKF